jgi:hypothetical protein
MSRYIDADALHDTLKAKQMWVVRCGDKHNEGYTYDQVHFAIDDAPSIDIVFCENCRECVEKGVGTDCPSGYGYLYCRRKRSVVNEGDYCSWGEREGERI